MTRNVGPEDRVVRLVIAAGLALLIFVGVLEGTAAIIAGVVAAVLALTGLLGMCLIYRLVGIDTAVHEQPYGTTDDRAGL